MLITILILLILNLVGTGLIIISVEQGDKEHERRNQVILGKLRYLQKLLEKNELTTIESKTIKEE